MSFPSHLFLPLSGAAVLAVAVLGTWLWPEPVVPPLKEPPPVAAPLFVQPPPPAPAPRPVRPVARAVPPAPPVQPVEPPRPVTVAPPREPVQVAVAPSYPPPPPGEPATGQPSAPRTRLSMMGHAASVLERGIQHIEQSRAQALARGDQAEAERLDKLIEKHRSRLGHLRRAPPQAQATDSGEPPKL